jgi:hypothetical protein
MISISETDNGTKQNVIRTLEEIRDNLEPAIAQELEAVMQKVLETAIELCPKDTGSLASSISLESGTIESGDFYGCSIFAGNEGIVNPVTGKPTSEYAQLVHDGHVLRDGTIYEGVPFLTEALMMYEDELESAVSRALSELKANTQE